MTVLWLWCLFVVKHGLLAHVIDFGYSHARSTKNPYWKWGLLGEVLVELAVTVLLLLGQVSQLSPWLAIEMVALIASCLLERRAPLTRLLHTHVLCELGVLVAYAALAFGVGE